MRRLSPAVAACIALVSRPGASGTAVGQQQPVPAQGCSIETINGRAWPDSLTKVAADQQIVLAGWAVDPRAHSVPLNLQLRFAPDAGVPVDVPVRYRIIRPDLMAMWRNDAYLIAGFRVTAAPHTLAPGTWRLSLASRTGDTPFLCDDKRAIEVIPAARSR